VGEMDGCALWRILLPFSELLRQGYQGIEWDLKDNDFLANIVHKFDAVVLPRMHWERKEQRKADKWFEALHKAGICVIYEIDDDLFSEDFERRLIADKGYTAERARFKRGSILHTIQKCDGITVSSQRLATMTRRYVDKPTYVVPNYIDLRWFKEIQDMNERKVEGLTVGWAGGLRPDKDIETMARAWGRLAEKYPDVTFVIQGHHTKLFYELVPEERIAMIDWMPIDAYPAGMVNIDIGCCPLTDTTFNRAKTYIKAMEYAASGAPVVASPTVYNLLIEHGVDGYIAETEDDWFDYLSRLIEDEQQRSEMADRLLAKVREFHSLEANAWRWVYAWTEIVSQYRAKKRKRIYLPKGVEVHANA